MNIGRQREEIWRYELLHNIPLPVRFAQIKQLLIRERREIYTADLVQGHNRMWFPQKEERGGPFIEPVSKILLVYGLNAPCVVGIKASAVQIQAFNLMLLLIIKTPHEAEDRVVEPSCDGRISHASVAQNRRKVIRKPLRVEPPSKDEQRP